MSTRKFSIDRRAPEGKSRTGDQIVGTRYDGDQYTEGGKGIMAGEPAMPLRHQKIGETRRHAARTLLCALPERDARASESAIHEQWRSGLAGIPALMTEGWYRPPDAGISVLIGEPPDYRRTNFRSLRHPVNRPATSATAGRDRMLFAYSSPVDRATAMIGDFQMTLYAGDDDVLRDHLAAALRVTTGIAEYARPGMELRELYHHAMSLMAEHEVVNDTRSGTDPSGPGNIGHTVPWSYCDYDRRIFGAIASDDANEVARIVRPAIELITGQLRRTIADDMAFTVEPQVISGAGVQASFHVIVDFLGGVKSVHTDFQEIFDAFGMTGYLAARGYPVIAAGDGDRRIRPGAPRSPR